MSERPTPTCIKSDWDGAMIGDPCEACGHTNVVHPGRHNPVIDECILCVLLALAASKQERIPVTRSEGTE